MNISCPCSWFTSFSPNVQDTSISSAAHRPRRFFTKGRSIHRKLRTISRDMAVVARAMAVFWLAPRP